MVEVRRRRRKSGGVVPKQISRRNYNQASKVGVSVDSNKKSLHEQYLFLDFLLIWILGSFVAF